jgi:hypothetical protein
MNLTARLLINISSTEPSTLPEIWSGMQGYLPEKGDTKGWKERAREILREG